MKNRCALYIRVSTNQQTTGLEAQERALREYCAHHVITDFEIYQDEGVSGAKTSRPGLDKLMEDVRSLQVQKVIVYSFSRFARSVKHLLTALEEFDSLAVSFVSITESIDTRSAMGRMVFQILGAVAELERELIRERVRTGLKNARAKGKKLGRTKTVNGAIIRELRKQGLSMSKIAQLTKVAKSTVHREITRSCSIKAG